MWYFRCDGIDYETHSVENLVVDLMYHRGKGANLFPAHLNPRCDKPHEVVLSHKPCPEMFCEAFDKRYTQEHLDVIAGLNAVLVEEQS